MARTIRRKSREMHGQTKTEIYQIWAMMVARCYDPNVRSFPRYGGRGIAVCDRWRESFASFASDIGPRPSRKHSLDRYPNRDGNYEPGNVRWATQKEQMHNSRVVQRVAFCNRIMSIDEFSAITGIKRSTVASRRARGMSPEEIIAFCPKRVSPVNRRLSDSQVSSLIRDRMNGDKLKVLAARYGLSESGVSLIANRKRCCKQIGN